MPKPGLFNRITGLINNNQQSSKGLPNQLSQNTLQVEVNFIKNLMHEIIAIKKTPDKHIQKVLQEKIIDLLNTELEKYSNPKAILVVDMQDPLVIDQFNQLPRHQRVPQKSKHRYETLLNVLVYLDAPSLIIQAAIKANARYTYKKANTGIFQAKTTDPLKIACRCLNVEATSQILATISWSKNSKSIIRTLFKYSSLIAHESCNEFITRLLTDPTFRTTIKINHVANILAEFAIRYDQWSIVVKMLQLKLLGINDKVQWASYNTGLLGVPGNHNVFIIAAVLNKRGVLIELFPYYCQDFTSTNEAYKAGLKQHTVTVLGEDYAKLIENTIFKAVDEFFAIQEENKKRQELQLFVQQHLDREILGSPPVALTA